MFDKDALANYADNLVHLANDVRRALKSPTLPVAIRAAQKEAAGRIEPAGSAVFVPTAKFARPMEESPNVAHGHHWFGNAESYFLIGDALGKAMASLVSE